MLNTNDVQLFCNLLDSLGTNLRDLAVRYEVLSRGLSDREKTDAAVQSMNSSILAMAKDVEALRKFAGEGREGGLKTEADIRSILLAVEGLLAKMEAIKVEASGAKIAATEGKAIILHVDSHQDAFGGQLATIQSMSTEIKRMVDAVEEMKKQFEPFKKIAVLVSKPVAILVAIYVIITTILAAVEGIQQIDKVKEKFFSSATNQVTRTKTP